MKSIALFLCFLISAPAFAQLSVEQRAFDFQVLASLYAKRYAPLQWKRDLFNFDVLDLKPWLSRVREAKDDVEFLELCKEYVASFDDLHTSFNAPGSLVADTGLFTDIYEGKVLVDGINRTLLPAARFPIAVGDEVVSIDGQPVEEVLAAITRRQKMGNPVTTRRYAADLLTFRPGNELPRTVELGDNLEIELRQSEGEIRKFTIPWVKTGYSSSKIGPVPSPRTAVALDDSEEEAVSPQAALITSLHGNAAWKVPSENWVARRFQRLQENREEVEGWVLGWGNRTPGFAPPAGFQQRLGRATADFHFSGTYTAEGKRIGYLRIPNFAPASAAAAQREIAGEIAFFRQNTDGLIVDVQRNTGGGCYMLTATAYLIPQRFWFFGQEIRPTQDTIASYQATLELARRLEVDQWLIDTIEFQLGMIKQAYNEPRGMTGPIPACSFTFENDPAKDATARVIAYEKPLIVLIDEFSTSAGDIFPAMMQDNKRGPLVGTRTNGAGGSISLWDTGFFMEATATNTDSLVTRREPRAVQGYPTSHYIENVGAQPDIPLERMTVENLRSGGRQFTDGFTRIMLEEIAKAP